MYKFFVKDTRDQGQDSDYIWRGIGGNRVRKEYKEGFNSSVMSFIFNNK